MRAGRRCLFGIVIAISSCKAVVGGDGYEIDDEAFVACGEGTESPTDGAIRACVNAISCNPNDPPYTISECLSADPMSEFTLKPTSYPTCADYDGDHSQTFVQPGDCTDDSLRCGEDNVFYNCSEGTRTDCTKRGGTCRLWTNASGTEAGGCEMPGLEDACPGTDTTLRCDGSVSYTCYDGAAIGRDCAREYATCDAADGTCYYDVGKRCTQLGAWWCEGDTAVFCSDGGIKYEYRCGEHGLTCDQRVGSVCIARGCTQKDYLACEEFCEDSVAHVCFGAIPLAFDCKNYGYTKCKRSTHADRDGLPFVRCVP